MPVLDRSLVLSWFVSRAKPFSSQFAQWINACWFKGEMIPAADIEGLEAYLGASVPPFDLTLSAEGSYTIPAGFAITKMYLKAVSGETISIGGDEMYVSGFDLYAGIKTGLSVDILADVAPNTIIFYGITSVTNIRIYLLKI